jgi:hypothetical protein
MPSAYALSFRIPPSHFQIPSSDTYLLTLLKSDVLCPFRIPPSPSAFRIPTSAFRHLFTNQRFGVILLQSGMDEKKI